MSQTYIAQSYVNERLQLRRNCRDILKECIGFADRHLQYIVDVLALISYSQRIIPISPATTFAAYDIDGRKEVHFDDLYSRTLTFLASAARDIEREASCLETSYLGVRSRFKEVADIIEHSSECCRIASRSPSYRTLVNLYKFVDILYTYNLVIWKRLQFCIVEPVLNCPTLLIVVSLIT